MRITFLGTGTSSGVPHINCDCETCLSSDPKDKRLRASVMVQEGHNNFLIDCGPDFRQQILAHKFRNIDGVILTHEHFDHVGGLDDLRPFHDIHIYAEKRVCNIVRSNMPYCFDGKKYPGVPKLNLVEINENPFCINDIKIIPIRFYHAELPILGYRIGNFAYLTDISRIEKSEIQKLESVKVLVVDALRERPHFSHFSLSEALAFIELLKPSKAYLTHICHQMGKTAYVQPKLPKGVYLAYDGLEVNVE